MNQNQRVREFSAGYYLVDNTNVIPYNGSRAIANSELIKELTQYVGAPIFKLGNSHEPAHAEKTVPADTVAVPDHIRYTREDPLLLAKEPTVLELMMSGEIGHT